MRYSVCSVLHSSQTLSIQWMNFDFLHAGMSCGAHPNRCITDCSISTVGNAFVRHTDRRDFSCNSCNRQGKRTNHRRKQWSLMKRNTGRGRPREEREPGRPWEGERWHCALPIFFLPHPHSHTYAHTCTHITYTFIHTTPG